MSAKDWMRLFGLALPWGGSFFFVDLALRGLPPFSVVWGRVAFGAGLLALALQASRTALPRGAAVWSALIGRAVLNNVVAFTLFVPAQRHQAAGFALIATGLAVIDGRVRQWR